MPKKLQSFSPLAAFTGQWSGVINKLSWLGAASPSAATFLWHCFSMRSYCWEVMHGWSASFSWSGYSMLFSKGGCQDLICAWELCKKTQNSRESKRVEVFFIVIKFCDTDHYKRERLIISPLRERVFWYRVIAERSCLFLSKYFKRIRFLGHPR